MKLLEKPEGVMFHLSIMKLEIIKSFDAKNINFISLLSIWCSNQNGKFHTMNANTLLRYLSVLQFVYMR